MKPILLDVSKYRGYKVLVTYNTSEYYIIEQGFPKKDYSFILTKKNIGQTLEKTFWMELYPDYFPYAFAYGYFDNDQLIALIEFTQESWNRRMRITEIWVDPAFRRKNIASDLVHFAIECAKNDNARMLILETQSCNTAAIDFYLKNGFSLVGYDLLCYSNNDVKNHEIRLEMGMIIGDSQ